MSETIYCAREQGRRAALSGRPLFANPHIGGDATDWFAGYREVPEEQRGSQPDLKTNPRAVKRARHPRGRAVGRGVSMSEAGIKALGDRTLKGSTPRTRGTLTAEQIASRIAYHERVLATSVCVHQRARAERALVGLRAAVPCDQHISTPRPWAVEGVGL